MKITIYQYFVLLSLLLISVLAEGQNWVSTTDDFIVGTPVETNADYWFPTYGGLVCMNKNSQQQTVYTGTNTEMKANQIADVEVDSNEIIWVTCHNELYIIQNYIWQRVVVISTGDTLVGAGQIRKAPDGSIYVYVKIGYMNYPAVVRFGPTGDTVYPMSLDLRMFDVDNNGVIWGGANNNLILKNDAGVVTVFDSSSTSIPNQNGFIQSLEVDHNNNVYVSGYYLPNFSGTAYKSIKFNGSNWVSFPVGNSNYFGIYEDRFNNLWFFAGLNALYKYDGTSFTTFTGLSPVPYSKTSMMYVAEDSSWWIDTWYSSAHFYHIINGVSHLVNLCNQSLSDPRFHSVKIDSKNNKWVALSGNGVMKFDGQNWISYNRANNGLNSDNVYLFIDSKDNIWAYSWDNEGSTAPLAKFDGISWTKYWLNGAPGSNLDSRCVAEDSAGNIWVGTDDGLARYDGLNWTYYNQQNSGLVNDGVWSLTFDNNGVLWIGTWMGLNSFDGTTWQTYSTSNSALPDNIVYRIISDSNNSKWLLTNSSFITKFDGVNWTNYPASLANTNYLGIDLIYDSYYGLIVGTNNGFSIFKNNIWQNYSAYNSDFVGLAYEFAIDKGKNIWIAAYDGGLITFNPDGINYTGYYSAPQFKISGKTFYDTNVNGNLDLGEYGLAYQRIECSTDSSVTFSNTTGNFALLKDTGNYDLTCLPSPGWNLSSFTSITNVQLDSTNVSNIDFGLYPNRTIRQAEIYLTSGGGRCFSQVDYWIDFSNTGTIPLAGKVVLEKDDSLLYISAFPIPDSVSGNRIVWNYILSPFVVAQIKVRLLNPLSLDTLMSTVSIEDNTGTLDSDTTYESILCSFDPNDKNCKPVGETDQHFVSVDDTLEYTIRFQNTGNDTAFNIMIVDTLSPFLDLSTFKMLGSSHAVNPQLKSDGGLTLYYDNINLLCEKVSEPESHGYFKYKIGIKNLWPVTGAIYNEASIYFDYNYPIVTNTTWHTVASSIDVSEPTERRQIIIFPVPAHNYVMINLEQMANNGILQIFDMSGILIEEMVVNKSSMKVNTERYPQGVLFIRYNDGINEYHTKFIILHN